MIVGYIVCLAVGVVAYFLGLKLALPWRITIALAFFVIPSIALTVWFVRTGDKPAPDAITITPKSSTTSDKDAKDSGPKK
jgi:hypothetical protein